MTFNPESARSPIQRHPPERRRRKGEPIVLYSCCCCCCCCLHTVGGAIGALVAGARTIPSREHDPVPDSLPSSQSIYWSSVLIIIAIGVCISVVMSIADGLDRPGVWYERFFFLAGVDGFLLLLFGPVVLLAGSVVMAIRLAVSAPYRQYPIYWRDLGRITLWNFLGTMLGVLLMVGIWGAFLIAGR